MPQTTDPATDLMFEEPPPPNRRGRTSPVTGWLAALREHPGKWAKYPTAYMTTGAGHRITAGEGYGVTAGEFEAVMRRSENGKAFHLYARYVGGE